MEYPDFINTAMKLDFIPDESTADSAVKAVVGILASRLDESGAAELTDSLPEPLTFERLRGDEKTDLRMQAKDTFGVLATQFSMDEKQASFLVREVLGAVKSTLPRDRQSHLEEALPDDWRHLLEAA